jgi:hypothetical protein
VRKHVNVGIVNALVFTAVLLAVCLAPHLKSLNIHDQTTFRLVGMLGILQTALALYGGYLAVIALPSDRQSRMHPWFFVIAGLGLFSLTFAAGVLSDHSQFDLSTKLDTANDALRNVGSLRGGLTNADRSYIHDVLGVTTSAKKSSAAAPAPPGVMPPTTPLPEPLRTQSPTSAPSANRQYDQQQADESVRETLRWGINDLSDKLRDVDSDAQMKRETVARALGVPGHFDTNTIPQLKAIDDNEIQNYLAVLFPQIQALRERAHGYFPASKTATGEQQFETANRLAGFPSHIPQSPFDLWNFRGGKFDPMRNYLFSLYTSMSPAPGPVPLIMVAKPLPPGIVGRPYSQTLEAKGGIPPYTWAIVKGQLPPNLVLSAGGGSISGTPTATGIFDVVFSVSDRGSPTRATQLATAIVVRSGTSPQQ